MPQRCLEQGFVRAVICRNCVTDNQQHHLPPNTAPLAGNSLIQHLTPAPLPGSSLIWRRYGGGVGNRCRWADRFAMSEQRQSMERHFQRSREIFRTDRGRPCPREWEDPQAKRCGGMERSGSLCGRVPAPRETRHGRQCGSIGKQLRTMIAPASKETHCWQESTCGQGKTLPAEVPIRYSAAKRADEMEFIVRSQREP